MEYRAFVELLKKGEKDTVDFKIQCEAFGHDDFAGKAELAKDICALANNGNVTSYIIIGVSDDGKSFKTVTNKNLTDDRLQDFCKKAIFSPPKVNLIKKRWQKSQPKYKGIKFAIIQVGPHPRQIFRINQDFIDYTKRVCYRRNEVWIRRGATSDLATPEETIRLSSGLSLKVGFEEPEKRADRENFKHASMYDKMLSIGQGTKQCFIENGYNILTPQKGEVLYYILPPSLTYRETHAECIAYKKIGFTVLIIYAHNCDSKLTERDLDTLRFTSFYPDSYAEWDKLPEGIRILTRRRIRSVRRISLKPIIGTVPGERISKVFSQSRRIGTPLHFYLPSFYHGQKEKSLISSSELLVLDKIRSKTEYIKTLKNALSEMEKDNSPLVKLREDNKEE